MATPIPANAAPLTPWSAAAATGGRVAHVRGEGAAARGVTTDSRAVSPGCAFVALRGERHDGHEYVERGDPCRGRARGRRGAGGEGDGVRLRDVVEVDDTLVAWGDLARAHLRAWRRGRVDARSSPSPGAPARRPRRSSAPRSCIGRALPRDRREPEQPRRRAGGRLRPRAAAPLRRPRGGDERPRRDRRAGAHRRARRRGRDERRPRARRGVGGTRDDVAREKGALFAALGEHAVAVANADDAAAMGQLARTRARHARTFGTGDDADYRLVERPTRALPARASGSGGAVSSPRPTRGCRCSARRPPSTWSRRSPPPRRWPARSRTTRSPRRSAIPDPRGAAAGRMQVRHSPTAPSCSTTRTTRTREHARRAPHAAELAQGRRPWWSSAR